MSASTPAKTAGLSHHYDSTVGCEMSTESTARWKYFHRSNSLLLHKRLLIIRTQVQYGFGYIHLAIPAQVMKVSIKGMSVCTPNPSPSIPDCHYNSLLFRKLSRRANSTKFPVSQWLWENSIIQQRKRIPLMRSFRFEIPENPALGMAFES